MEFKRTSSIDDDLHLKTKVGAPQTSLYLYVDDILIKLIYISFGQA